MAYLNAQERDALLSELSRMDFNKAKARLRRMNHKAKLALFRNVQYTGEWITRYDLPGLGTRVTLVEDRVPSSGDPNRREQAKYELVKVIVEPLPENRT